MSNISSLNTIEINDIKIEQKANGSFFITAFSQDEKDRAFWEKALHDYSLEWKSEHQIGNGSDVSRMLYELEFEYDITVGGISCDMWMGILLKNKDYDLVVECDNAEYGFLCGILVAKKLAEQQ